MRILGIDPSLTGTGLCTITLGRDHEPRIFVETLKTKLTGHERLQFVLRQLGGIQLCDLVVIEGPAYGAARGQSGHHERAGLWWAITQKLWLGGVPYAVVSPGARSKYGAGKGNAAKMEVMAAAIRRYGHLVDIDDDNQADALILAAMGAHQLGRPIVMPPAAHCTAMTAVGWPELLSDEDTAA